MWTAESLICFRILHTLCICSTEILMPCIPVRKRRKLCSLVTGESGTAVPHDSHSYIYIHTYCSSTDNPLLVDRKKCLFYINTFEISSSYLFLSAVPKLKFHLIFLLKSSIWPYFYLGQQWNMFGNSWFLLLQDFNIFQLFAVKQFDLKSVC
jgi:hypothetical protein